MWESGGAGIAKTRPDCRLYVDAPPGFHKFSSTDKMPEGHVPGTKPQDPSTASAGFMWLRVSMSYCSLADKLLYSWEQNYLNANTSIDVKRFNFSMQAKQRGSETVGYSYRSQ